MQQPPQDPNQQFTPNQSHQGFVPDAAYAPASTIGDEIGLEPQESIEDVVKKIEKRNKAFSLAISIGFTVLIGVILYFWAITAFQEEEIELVVAATQGEKDAQIEKRAFSKASAKSLRVHPRNLAARYQLTRHHLSQYRP